MCSLLCFRVNCREIGIEKDNYSNREEQEEEKLVFRLIFSFVLYEKSVASCDLVTKEMIQIYPSYGSLLDSELCFSLPFI